MAHPTIDRIRRARREMAAEHDYDPKKLFAYYRRFEAEEEEEAERTSVLGELHALIQRLEEREERAEAEGMRELAMPSRATERASQEPWSALHRGSVGRARIWTVWKHKTPVPTGTPP